MNNLPLIMILSTLMFFNADAVKAEEKPTLGQGYYSIQNKTFPCDDALKVFDGVKRPALMFLWGTFGDDLKCVKKFLNLPQRKKEIYIHFSNECCRRNNTCKRGELLPRYSVKKLNTAIENNNVRVRNAFRKRATSIFNFIEDETDKHPNTAWFLSTGLEDNYSFPAKKRVLRWLRAVRNKSPVKGSVRLYVNPLDQVCIMKRCEIHEKNTGYNNHWLYIPDGYCVKPFDKCNYNVFSEKALNDKLNKQQKNGNKFFIWWQEQQGRYGEPAHLAQPPRQRKIIISKTQIKNANKFLKKGN